VGLITESAIVGCIVAIVSLFAYGLIGSGHIEYAVQDKISTAQQAADRGDFREANQLLNEALTIADRNQVAFTLRLEINEKRNAGG
jgi:thioredoxin-like negative regulator of GroEL